ncbi:UNVERIFIED_CONTAM: Protein NSP-INTERACTING KINASE 3 [Sesamum indicum]
MASPGERSSSSISTNYLMPGRIVIAYDATKNHSAREFKEIIANIQMRDDMIQEVDMVTVLGVLHKMLHPLGFQMQIGPDSFIGTRVRAIKGEVSRMVDALAGMLQRSAEECEGNGGRLLAKMFYDVSIVSNFFSKRRKTICKNRMLRAVGIEVKIVVGAPLNKVVVQETVASNATWVVLDRHLRKESRFYLKHIPCKVALILDNFSLEVLRPYYSDKATVNTEHKLFYSFSKLVPLLPVEYNTNNEQPSVSPCYHESMSSQESSDSERSSFASSLTSKSKEQGVFSPDEFGSNHQQEKSGSYTKVINKYDNSPPVMQKQGLRSHSNVPVHHPASEMKLDLDAKTCDYSEVQIAGDDFSSGNLEGRGTNAKVERESLDSYIVMQKQTKLQTDCDAPLTSDEMKMELYLMGCSYSDIQIATNDFSSENLLGEGGYGVVYKGQLKDGQLITVKVQKEANTQDNMKHVLEWHRRHAIAIGIAKGLRYLHEECRGSPIIHRDIRLSKIYLTHEFVPLLGDCGLAKWEKSRYGIQTKLLGTLEYLAPEYAENGICSVKTDVFSFGIVLIQLISGRKAIPLIQTLALNKLVDPRLGDSYSTYELYQMARVAYLCIQTKPAMRPTMGEVLHLLEGENDHLQHLTKQFIPRFSTVQKQVLHQIKRSRKEDRLSKKDLSYSESSGSSTDAKPTNDFRENQETSAVGKIETDDEEAKKHWFKIFLKQILIAMGSSNNSSKDNAFMTSRILIVCDATKDRSPHEFRHTIHNIRMRGGIVHPGDTITVFGVLHRILHPMGYQMGVTPDYVLGTTHVRAMEEEVSKRVDMYVGMLQYSAEECEEQGYALMAKHKVRPGTEKLSRVLTLYHLLFAMMVDIKVKIMAGTPIRKVIVQEVATSNPAWVILDRHLRRECRYYLKHISCKVALVQDNLSLEILRSYCAERETDYLDDKQFHSLSKPVPQPPVSDNENSEQSVATNSHDGYATSSESSDMAKSSSLSSFTSNSKDYSLSWQDEFGSNPKQGESANCPRVDIKRYASPTVMPKQRRKPSRRRSSDVPVLCISCGLKTELDSMRYTYSEIQLATNDFASDNLLGEGGYGFVYKGKLRNGQLIAAKVRKEASTQGFEEFLTEVFVLSFARHKNIVMLLGYCCKENLNILVYEFICNKSLEWHLFENTSYVLEWHRRHAIAIGTAKGLRFLHEECRGSPIIYRDMRPSNILLTHDFVPMVLRLLDGESDQYQHLTEQFIPHYSK